MCLQVMIEAGPLQSRLLAKGPESIGALKSAFLKEFESAQETFTVNPCARTVLLQKPLHARL